MIYHHNLEIEVSGTMSVQMCIANFVIYLPNMHIFALDQHLLLRRPASSEN